MAKGDDIAAGALLIGAGLFGLGYLFYSGYEQRRTFKETLASRLRERGLDLFAADLGRMESGAPSWHVTVQHPLAGVQALVATFEPDTDPYSPSTLNALVTRVAAWFQPQFA